jgi:DNA-binding MarR family transcriptional regulator
VGASKGGSDEIRRAIGGLQRLADLLAERRAQLAKEAGLTEQQWRLLEQIAAPGFLPSLFARQSDVTPAAVSKILRQLLDKGLVQVSISERDARQREYLLAAGGRKALARIETAREDAVRTVWAALDPRDVKRFAELAEELAERLDGYARARRPQPRLRRA